MPELHAVILILKNRVPAECTCNTEAKYFWTLREKSFEYLGNFISQTNMYKCIWWVILCYRYLAVKDSKNITIRIKCFFVYQRWLFHIFYWNLLRFEKWYSRLSNSYRSLMCLSSRNYPCCLWWTIDKTVTQLKTKIPYCVNTIYTHTFSYSDDSA